MRTLTHSCSIRSLACGKRIVCDERGASAIEFSILAPVLAFACLAAVDCGLAIGEKMSLDYSLRAASEGAIADLGESDVHDLLNAVASEQFTVAADDAEIVSDGAVTTEVARFCTCPEDTTTAVDCGTGGCAAAAKPYVYYRLSGQKDYLAIFLPEFPLGSSLLVQVE